MRQAANAPATSAPSSASKTAIATVPPETDADSGTTTVCVGDGPELRVTPPGPATTCRKTAPVERGVTADVVGAQQAQAASRKVTVEASIGPAMTAGDPRLAERLVTNLLDNAIRYNQPVGGWVRIRTGTVDGSLPSCHSKDTTSGEPCCRLNDSEVPPMSRRQRVSL